MWKMTKKDKIQHGRRLFENWYISTQERKPKSEKYSITNITSLISAENHYQGILHIHIIFYFC